MTPADTATSTAATVDGVVLDVGDAAFEEVLRDDLLAVEERLSAAVGSEHPFVDETARYLRDAGGKRFRPLVALLSAHVAAADARAPAPAVVVDAAVALELTHLSTLYHDDVMDEAAVRRGAASANDRWGNTVAILTGDFLFARASEITADLGSEATRILARTIAVLCEGQIRETVGPRPGQDPVEHWDLVVAEKTSSLIATSARLGALLAGAPGELVERLAAYGEVVGTAFQLSDDLLDLAGRRTESGKEPGTDLREGVLTLPVLLALRHDGGAGRLARLLDGVGPTAGGLDGEGTTEALAVLSDHPGVEHARERLRAEAARARTLVADLPAGPARRALEVLADVVVLRSG